MGWRRGGAISAGSGDQSRCRNCRRFCRSLRPPSSHLEYAGRQRRTAGDGSHLARYIPPRQALRWRNGKRCGLKIRWEISLVGSIPTRSMSVTSHESRVTSLASRSLVRITVPTARGLPWPAVDSQLVARDYCYLLRWYRPGDLFTNSHLKRLTRHRLTRGADRLGLESDP